MKLKDISKTAILIFIVFISVSVSTTTTLPKTMRFELTGTTVNLVLRQAQTGLDYDPLYTQTAISKASMVFDRNGHGSMTGNNQYLITGVYDLSLLGELSWSDSTEWTAEFTYQISRNNEVTLYVIAGTWKGKMISGSAAGAKYTVE
jgi:hypothetical protein